MRGRAVITAGARLPAAFAAAPRAGFAVVVTLVVVVLAVVGLTTGPAPRPPAALAPVVAGTEPVAAGDPAGLARQIAAAEAVIADPARPPDQVAAAGRTTQVAYGALATHPDWDAAVTGAVPPRVADTVRAVVAARRDLADMDHGPPATKLPAWRIVEPWAPERLRATYDEAERRFGVPWTVLAAVNLVETQMGRIVGRSGAGAQGPMQFMPATWARYGLGGDVWDPHDAILGAANYLRAMGATSGGDAGLDHAVWRYDNDMRYVRAVRAYAGVMAADPRALLGFHAWTVRVGTVAGAVVLPTGYDEARPLPVAEFLARRPTPAPGS